MARPASPRRHPYARSGVHRQTETLDFSFFFFSPRGIFQGVVLFFWNAQGRGDGLVEELRKGRVRNWDKEREERERERWVQVGY